MAQKAACPVLPVGLTGTQECLPKGAKWPRRVPVSVTFGKPFIVATKRPDGSRVTPQTLKEAFDACFNPALGSLTEDDWARPQVT